jgi:6,7-dimethyl-8-ribityllumazine synthase
VTNALMNLQFEVKKPIIFGVLTTLSLAQAEERAHSALAASWADSALCMTRFAS